jgi:hypothetical protein
MFVIFKVATPVTIFKHVFLCVSKCRVSGGFNPLAPSARFKHVLSV